MNSLTRLELHPAAVIHPVGLRVTLKDTSVGPADVGGGSEAWDGLLLGILVVCSALPIIHAFGLI